MGVLSDKSRQLSKAFGRRNVIIPNFITILGLLSGVYSIMLSVSEKENSFIYAAYFLVLAAIFDGLDGKVARLVNGTSDFGIQLDSLCDLVSFGVAPAILMYEWVLKPLDRVGVMAVFLFVACGALRLARFNVQAGKISNAYFVGLPIPGAAAFIAASVLFLDAMRVYLGEYADHSNLSIFFLISTYFLGFLMVSSIPFFSFKRMNYFKEHPFRTLVFMIIIISIFVLKFEIFFFVSIVVYITVNIFIYLIRLLRMKKVENSQNI